MTAGADDTWTAKEVFADLKGDIMGRFDKQDKTLVALGNRLDNTATKDDIAHLTLRVDGHEGRITTLETDTMTVGAVSVHKRETWKVAGYVAALIAAVGTCIGTLLAVH